MSVKQFKFVSPGIFINEIDQSATPVPAAAVGPVIIGRTKRGPAYRPTRVESFSDYLEVFGEPVPGAQGDDAWRSGVPHGPTYASYAAQAYLRNNSPVTVIRTLGSQAPDATTGLAGWNMGDASSPGGTGEHGGAYGLFVFASASATTSVTGSLAAIWYCDDGGIALSGSMRGESMTDRGSNISGSSTCINADSDGNFTALVVNGSGSITKKAIFNFNADDDKYIRKVFNTDPTLVNTSITTTNAQESYFLGQSYDASLFEAIDTDAQGQGATLQGVILGIGSGSAEGGNYRYAARAAQSGWIISQDIRTTAANKTESSANSMTFSGEGTDVTRLFKFHTLSEGEWEQRNLKISIERVKGSDSNINKYGTFSVVLRKIEDNDKNVVVVERFDNLSLNPDSPDYIAARIGDTYSVWDSDRRRLQDYGTYANQSKFVRVEMGNDVDNGQADPELVPFGFFGPVIPNGFTTHPGVTIDTNKYQTMTGSGGGMLVKGGMAIFNNNENQATVGVSDNVIGIGATNTLVYKLELEMNFPSHRLRKSSMEGGLSNHLDAYWGIDTTRSGSGALAFARSNIDLAHALPKDVAEDFAPGANTTTSFVFTLDDLSGSSVGTDAASGVYSKITYQSGSRAAGSSITAASGSYKSLLSAFRDVGGAKFTLPLFGGHDGLNILEREPFNDTRALASAATDQTSYAYYSTKKAIDMVADPEYVDMNLAAMPGVVNENLTKHLVDTCEARGDALAIIDPRGGYSPSTEDATTEQNRTSTTAAKTVSDNMKARNIDSSYGAAYFPWVQIKDSINGRLLFVPPSVIGLGVLGSSETKTAVWFAPAGFNRGGLTEGAAGLNVTGVRHKLTSEERDRLYESNINPIATFPSEGIVIFGQKTLQVSASALDRINVRRLLIFAKKGISRIASTTLFQQNLEATWADFKYRADTFLSNVQAGLGLEEYKVVLDRSTTTPDLVDRNIMYAKIFLKPARAIEFIALDFVVTNAGASFED